MKLIKLLLLITLLAFMAGCDSHQCEVETETITEYIHDTIYSVQMVNELLNPVNTTYEDEISKWVKDGNIYVFHRTYWGTLIQENRYLERDEFVYVHRYIIDAETLDTTCYEKKECVE